MTRKIFVLIGAVLIFSKLFAMGKGDGTKSGKPLVVTAIIYILLYTSTYHQLLYNKKIKTSINTKGFYVT